MSSPPNAEEWPKLHGVPSISTRISIAWPPSPAFEDSDVLVLSSRSTLPGSSMTGNMVLYLDLRLSVPISPTSKIRRAFAGIRHTIPLTEEERDDSVMVRFRWGHTIDSNGSGGPSDEGTMIKQIGEDGSEVEVETGVGLDPVTGKLGRYEEIWKDENLSAESPFVFLISGPSPNASTMFMAVLGEHAMALSQQKNGGSNVAGVFTAVRLRRIEGQNSKGWEIVFSNDKGSLKRQLEELAAMLLSHEKPWKRGDGVMLRDHEELERWTVWDAGYVEK